jgi:hypothetical protein
MRTEPERSNLMSQSEYARRRGVSQQAVNKAVRAGRIPTTNNGMLDPVVADAAWDRNTRPRSDLAPDDTPDAVADDSGSSHDLAARDRPQATYTAARALREVYLAKQAKLDFERSQAKLIPVEEVRLQTFLTARGVRNRLLALPARLAPVLFGASDVGECQRLLEEALLQVCSNLAPGTEMPDSESPQ